MSKLSNCPGTQDIQISYHTHSLVTGRFCNAAKAGAWRRTWWMALCCRALPLHGSGTGSHGVRWPRHELRGGGWQGNQWHILHVSLCHGKHMASENSFLVSLHTHSTQQNLGIRQPKSHSIKPLSSFKRQSFACVFYIIPVPAKWAYYLWCWTSHVSNGGQRKNPKTITDSFGGRRPFPSV